MSHSNGRKASLEQSADLKPILLVPQLSRKLSWAIATTIRDSTGFSLSRSICDGLADKAAIDIAEALAIYQQTLTDPIKGTLNPHPKAPKGA